MSKWNILGWMAAMGMRQWSSHAEKYLWQKDAKLREAIAYHLSEYLPAGEYEHPRLDVMVSNAAYILAKQRDEARRSAAECRDAYMPVGVARTHRFPWEVDDGSED